MKNTIAGGGFKFCIPVGPTLMVQIIHLLRKANKSQDFSNYTPLKEKNKIPNMSPFFSYLPNLMHRDVIWTLKMPSSMYDIEPGLIYDPHTNSLD